MTTIEFFVVVVSIIAQLEIEAGEPLFDVEYDGVECEGSVISECEGSVISES